MKMEVEIISQGCVAPSSPTPPHLKTYNISLLDQFMPYIYYPMILFYPNYQNTNLTNYCILQRSTQLKQSLSETLSWFYPFAGRVKNSFSTIDCNDEGVYYAEGRANSPLAQYLNPPDLISMQELLPYLPPLSEPTTQSYLAMVQETTFSCGGFAIAFYVSHILCDGTGAASFLKSWAAIASKSSKKILDPYMHGPSVFPQYTPFPEDAKLSNVWIPFLRIGKYTTKRFVFNSSAIANLRAEAATNSSMKNPTRVEVVTALLSKCIMATYKNKTGIDKPLAISHNVNLRRRAEPPLQECSMGNFIWPVATICTSKENELSGLVRQLREAIEKVDSDFVKNIEGDDGFFKLYEDKKEISDLRTSPIFPGGAMDYISFTSWCNFGLYDVDFGWGKPIWTSCIAFTGDNKEIPYINAAVLMDARTERGVEAWVLMKEDDLALLEKEKELLQYASINPTALE